MSGPSEDVTPLPEGYRVAAPCEVETLPICYGMTPLPPYVVRLGLDPISDVLLGGGQFLVGFPGLDTDAPVVDVFSDDPPETREIHRAPYQPVLVVLDDPATDPPVDVPAIPAPSASILLMTALLFFLRGKRT